MASARTKQQLKQVVRRTIGEPYVGKRLKMRNIKPAFDRLSLVATSILDAGAEDATFVYWLAERFPLAQVTAVDIDEAAIAACAAARPSKYNKRVRFQAGTFAELASEAYDLITAFDVLEHIEDDHAALAELSRALRPGGSLAIHVPRDQWTHSDGRVEIVSDADAWRINDGHVRMGYSPPRLRSLVSSCGLEVVEVQTWLRRWGVFAHQFYARVERWVPLRILTLPLTDCAAVLDRRRPSDEGNTVWLVARKPLVLPSNGAAASG